MLKLDEVMSTLTAVKGFIHSNSKNLDEMHKTIAGLERKHATDEYCLTKVEGKFHTVKGRFPSIAKKPRCDLDNKEEERVFKGNTLFMFDPSEAGHCSPDLTHFIDCYTDTKSHW